VQTTCWRDSGGRRHVRSAKNHALAPAVNVEGISDLENDDIECYFYHETTRVMEKPTKSVRVYTLHYTLQTQQCNKHTKSHSKRD
jgi:hypothetical protein